MRIISIVEQHLILNNIQFFCSLVYSLAAAFITFILFFQMGDAVPESIKEEFRRNLANGNEKFNEK